jgi:hypothetical protein
MQMRKRCVAADISDDKDKSSSLHQTARHGDMVWMDAVKTSRWIAKPCADNGGS